MKCLVCRRADTRPGTTSITLARGEATIVFRDVPAQVCPDCGEDYVDEIVAGTLLHAAEEMAAAGTQGGVRTYPKT